MKFSFHPLRFAAKALTVIHDCHPDTRLLSSTILLHVVFGRPGLLLLSGLHSYAVTQFSTLIFLIIIILCSGSSWENIGPRSLLFGPRCSRSVLSRPWADILPERPSRLVNHMYIFTFTECCASLHEVKEPVLPWRLFAC